jgi:hypothetical protein
LGALSGSWYIPSVTRKLGDPANPAISATTASTTATSTEDAGSVRPDKEYAYDEEEEEEGEVGESEGRWKR